MLMGGVGLVLKQVVSELGQSLEQRQLIASIQKNPCPFESGIYLGIAVQKVICDWIVHLHKSEADMRKTALVFLPTYRALEEQWSLLKATGLDFKLYILHSSIDMDHLMTAIEASGEERKVILATNVAESSLTIPNVSYVIDSCRSLEIYWSNASKKHLPRLVWESQSQADQRKGRTGRTCNGVVYRMIPGSVYYLFKKFETPALQLVSLRKQVLMLACAKSRAINDPRGLFQKSMSPPDAETVDNAYQALVTLGALEVSKDQRGKYGPTFYGRLLGNLPLSLESSMLVIKGAEAGFIRECATLAAILDTSPYPIMQPFGGEKSFHDCFYQVFSTPDKMVSASQSSILLANLYAFEFWQHNFKDKHRMNRLLAFGGNNEPPEMTADSKPGPEDLELKWCIKHHLSRASLQAVAETVDAIMAVMHQFRPKFMNTVLESPANIRSSVNHECICSSYHVSSQAETATLEEFCIATPYVSSEIYHTRDDDSSLSHILMEVRANLVNSSISEAEGDTFDATDSTVPLCSFFQMGSCNKGEGCQFSHSLSAKPAVCKFFMSASGCRFGEDCRFWHDYQNFSSSTELITEAVEITSSDMLKHFTGDSYVLLVGDADFSFAKNLGSLYDPRKILASAVRSKDEFLKSSHVREVFDEILQSGIQVLWEIDPSKFAPGSCIQNMREHEKLWVDVGCILWNFPFLGSDEDTSAKRISMGQFFASVSVMLMMLEKVQVRVLLTMSNSQYAQLQVERAARESFFFLTSSFPPHEIILTCYNCRRKPMEGSLFTKRFITYAFEFGVPVGQHTKELKSHFEELSIS